MDGNVGFLAAAGSSSFRVDGASASQLLHHCRQRRATAGSAVAFAVVESAVVAFTVVAAATAAATAAARFGIAFGAASSGAPENVDDEGDDDDEDDDESDVGDKSGFGHWKTRAWIELVILVARLNWGRHGGGSRRGGGGGGVRGVKKGGLREGLDERWVEKSHL